MNIKLQFFRTKCWDRRTWSSQTWGDLIESATPCNFAQVLAFYLGLKPVRQTVLVAKSNAYNITPQYLPSSNHLLFTQYFISPQTAKDYPIYGLQWHPEKPSFEWNPALNMDKSFDSIIFGQAMGNFFINEARKNCNKFKSKRAETRALMHSYYPLYTGDVSTTDQMYIF